MSRFHHTSWRTLLFPVLSCLLGSVLRSVSSETPVDPSQPLLWSYDTVAEYPHDPNAFTQGLTFDRECSDSSQQCFDVFWESTGLNGRSSVRQVDANTGQVLMRQDLSCRALCRGARPHRQDAVPADVADFKGAALSHAGMASSGLKDGWGLAFDGVHLLATESSAQVHWLDPQSLAVVKSLTVTDRGQPIKWLNELEVIDGELWANIWQRECIARIDLSTGKVVGWVLLHGLREAMLKRRRRDGQVDVLNGRIFVTGKLWPSIFEIRLKPVEAPKHKQALDSIPSLCWPPS
ncbi:MAG: hypothetical protein WDW38_009822 [Sanguina aurantia]